MVPLPAPDLHPATLRRLLGECRLGRPVCLLEQTSSTNDVAAAAAAKGAPEGALFVAAGQSAGRGRAGRGWVSLEGGLAFSLLLRPARNPAGLTCLFGLAAVRAIDRFAAGAGVKWPNDVWIDGLKAGGILAEAKGGAVVVGMGLDVNETPAALAAGVDAPAVSLRVAAKRVFHRGEVLAAILDSFGEIYDAWTREGFAPVRGAYEERMLWRGERVTLPDGLSGRLAGVDDAGCAVVETNGGRRVIAAGDLSLRKEEP
ncbi:MAG: biotin--[acetyl-CoA-carboxylase] ligase [Candidatus Krumholzibacteriota bacterium]|nr:biotin--[acetyl-CoA-carboxylase] ligase [Candidatus Krumholzibacteriota bacterium]